MSVGYFNRMVSTPIRSSCGDATTDVGLLTYWKGDDNRKRINAYYRDIIRVNNYEIEWLPNSAPDNQTPFSGTFPACFGIHPGFLPRSGPTVEEMSTIRLLGALRGHNFSPSVSLAEGIKTSSMITQTATTLAKTIRSLRRGDFSAAGKHLGVRTPKRIARSADPAFDAWLQLKYGWLPLIKDVKNAAEALGRHHTPPSLTIKAVAVVEREVDNRFPFLKGSWSNRASAQHKVRLTQQLSTAASLQLGNISAVAWELTPFSFVADWFLPVGDYIENFCTAQQAQGLVSSGSITTKRKTETEVYGVEGYRIYGENFSSSSFEFERNPNVSITPPLPNLREPPWTLNRMFTSLALLSSVSR